MLKKLEELPKGSYNFFFCNWFITIIILEWTIIQITSKFNLLESINVNIDKCYTNNLHICVFNAGQCKEMPICITTGLPTTENSNTTIELMMELRSIVRENDGMLTELGPNSIKTTRQRKEYYIDLRQKLAHRLEVIKNYKITQI